MAFETNKSANQFRCEILAKELKERNAKHMLRALVVSRCALFETKLSPLFYTGFILSPISPFKYHFVEYFK